MRFCLFSVCTRTHFLICSLLLFVIQLQLFVQSQTLFQWKVNSLDRQVTSELNCHQAKCPCIQQLVMLLCFSERLPNIHSKQCSGKNCLETIVAVKKCSYSLNYQTLITFWCSFMWYKYPYYSRDKFRGFFNLSVDAVSLYFEN